MSDVFKVYLFYLLPHNEFYAFTINKEYKKKFLMQRNKKCFTVRKEYMTDLEYRIFSHKYATRMLEEIPLNTSLDEYTFIIATPVEDDKLNYEATQMQYKMDNLYKRLVLQSDIKTKYIDSFEYLLSTYVLKKQKDGTKDSISRINLLFLFSQLFKNTFYEDCDE